ncbi:MAG: YbjN domain-containing protein [Chloroflexi bacterium]|nr:YbjN domain-containing protein [Chloroflexota bacterium]
MFGRGRKPLPPTPSLETYAAVVEQILPAVGVDPVTARMNTEEGFGWNFQRGSARIEIFISIQNNVGYFQVLAPIMHLPAQGLLPLYRRLLELNLQLTNAAFGVHMDIVYVFSERPLNGLDANEANNIISLVAAYADDMDNKLVEEFGGRLHARV